MSTTTSRTMPVMTSKTPRKPPLVPLTSERLISSQQPRTPPKSAEMSPNLAGPPALDLIATRAIISVSYGYAKKLLVDEERRRLFKLQCFTKLELERKSSMLNCEHTVLAYMDWGIGSIEKAAASLVKETREELLEQGEHTLKALTSLDLEGLTAEVPNSYIVGLAHLYLALVWKLRKNENRVSAHFLEIFVACPGYARKNFAPELWEELFRPYFRGIETWYRREYAALTNPDISLPESPLNQTPRRSNASDIRRAQPTKKENMTENNCSEEAAQVDLLNKLYEEALNESTQQYAQQYQEWIICYAGRDGERSDKLLQTEVPRLVKKSSGDTSPFDNHSKTETISESEQLSGKNILRMDYSGGWRGSRPLPLRRSLYEAIFGTLTMGKPNRRAVQGFFQKAVGPCNTDLNQVLCYTTFCDSKETSLLKMLGGKFSNMNSPIDEKKEIAPEDLAELQNRSPSAETQSDENSLPQSAYCNRSRDLTWKKMQDHHFQQVGSPRRLIDMLQDSESEMPLHYSCSMDKRKTNSDTMKKELGSVNATKKLPIRDESPFEGMPLKTVRAGSRLEKGIKKSRSSSFSIAEEELHRKKLFSVKLVKDCACNVQAVYGDAVALDKRHPYGSTSIQEWMERGNKKYHGTSLDTIPMMNFAIKDLVEKQLEKSSADEDENVEADGGPCTGFLVSSVKEQKSVKCTKKSPVFPTVKDRGYNSANASPCNELVSKSNTIAKQYTSEQLISSNVNADLHSETGRLEGLVITLKTLVSTSRDANNIRDCEAVLLKLSHKWLESKHNPAVENVLLEADIIHELMYVLSTSKVQEAQRISLCILSALIARNEGKKNQIMQVDPELQALSKLLKDGNLPEAALLLYLINPAYAMKQLPEILPLLLEIAQCKRVCDEMRFPNKLTPRAIALMMMEQLLSTADSRTKKENCKRIMYLNAIPCLVGCLDSSVLDEKTTAASILTSCMQADGDCRRFIAPMVKVASMVELLHNSKRSALKAAIDFISEIICLSRRKSIIEVLQQIRKEGVLNCLHVLMMYLQSASLENQPLAAGLLLQLDMLSDQNRYSVFREEALDALVAALCSEDNREAKVNSARVLARIGGRFSSSGESSVEAWLLKKAGIVSCINPDMDSANDHAKEYILDEDEMAAEEWDRKIASTVISYGKPVVEALGKGIGSEIAEVKRPCLIAATWLSCFLQQEKKKKKNGDETAVAVDIGGGDYEEEEAMEMMRESLEEEMKKIVEPGGSWAIDERIFAALVLQNCRCLPKPNPSSAPSSPQSSSSR